MTHATVSLVSFILFLSYTAVTVTSTTLHPVPVLLWSPSGDSSVSSPSALGSLSSDKFSDLIQNELDKNPFTVLFVEETLSVEDLSLKGNSGLNPYEGIRKSLKDGRATYLPAVNGPIHVINQLFKDSPVSRVSLTEHGLKTDVTPEEEPRLLVVRLRDANEGEPRLHFLARHDVFITNMLEKLTEKHGKDGVLAIYTGRMPSWSLPEPEKNSHFRLKRAAGDEAGNTTIKDFYNLDQIFVYATQFQIAGGENTTTLENPTATVSNVSETELKLSFAFTNGRADFSIVAKNDGYWYIDLVNVTDKDKATATLRNYEVYAPSRGFSYHCSPKAVFSGSNETMQLLIENFQIQPFFFDPHGDVKFDRAYDCVSYFTIPIWSGLFIVFFLLFILFFGIYFMMSIHTMDRFDDPKGKTITINVSE